MLPTFEQGLEDVALVELGVAGQVAMEQRMGCGLGMCFCCVSPFRSGGELVYRRVCCDGPVFDIQDATAW